MDTEFQWWLLLVGVVAGAALTWLVMADSRRHDEDLARDEIRAEAGWIAGTLAEEGTPVEADDVARILWTHRRYLGLPPPDALVEPEMLTVDDRALPPPAIGERQAGEDPGQPHRGAAPSPGHEARPGPV